MTIKVCILGSQGRVGQHLVSLSQADNDLALSCEINISTDFSSIKEDLKNSDVLIDFTGYKIISQWISILIDSNITPAIVSGSTGHTEQTMAILKNYSNHAPILVESNMSLGVNILYKVIKEIAGHLAPENGYKSKITEAHHVNKLDAPSGTAKTLLELLGQKHKDCPVESIREGDIVGEHTVLFNSSDEELTFSHVAKNREIFAKGALVAAKWIAGKPNGFYNMSDVLKDL